MANERLRTAMAKAQVDAEAIAKTTSVDPKTVQRWLSGRVPHPRHRWALARMLAEDESYLWPTTRPDLAPGAEATTEVVAAYGRRADAPRVKWSELLTAAREHVDILGYAFLFLPEQLVELPDIIAKMCAAGGKVRIAMADPDCTHVRERDELERLGGTLPARIRMTLNHRRDVRELSGAELRFHGIHLYNAMYRFDDHMLVTPYLHGAHGFQHPLLHLRRLGPCGIFSSFARQFDEIWSKTTPASHQVFADSPDRRKEI